MYGLVRDYLLWHAFAQTPGGRLVFGGLGALLRWCWRAFVWCLVASVVLYPVVAAASGRLGEAAAGLLVLGLLVSWKRREALRGWWERRQRRRRLAAR